MKKTGVFLLFTLTLLGCTADYAESKGGQVEDWKVGNYIDSVQILLTNEYQLHEAFGYGASSFLIKAKGDTLLCTAKHLLGEAMGISPEVTADSFDSAFNFWKAFPRQDQLSKDTIVCSKLITHTVNNVDIILLDCELGIANDIIALTPRFSLPQAGEKFEIIGCEYVDADCGQRKYFVTMDSYEAGQLLMKSETIFDPSGFSGAPVIDSKGLVIGLLSGGGEFDGELYLSIEPLSKLANYLK